MRWKDLPRSWRGRIHKVKITILQKTIFTFNETSLKLQNTPSQKLKKKFQFYLRNLEYFKQFWIKKSLKHQILNSLVSLTSHILVFPVPIPSNTVFPHNSIVIIFNCVLIILVDSRACNCHVTRVEVRRKPIRGSFLFPSSCGVQESTQVMKCVKKGPFYLPRHCWPGFGLFILLHRSITLLVIQIRVLLYLFLCLPVWMPIHECQGLKVALERQPYDFHFQPCWKQCPFVICFCVQQTIWPTNAQGFPALASQFTVGTQDYRCTQKWLV